MCSACQSSRTLSVISDNILWYGYISMCGHVILEEKVSTALMSALPRPLPTLYVCLSPLQAKTFSSLWEKLETCFITVENSCWVLKKVQRFFFYQNIINLLKPKTEREKCVMLESNGYLKKSTIIHSLCTIFWCLLQSLDKVILLLLQMHKTG
jgi:hypothetical protein